jgi:hypothetical protein
MKLVNDWDELERNLMELERLAGCANPRDLAAYRKLIANGICFVVYRRGGYAWFAPSRFVGSVANTLRRHDQDRDKNGRETTPAIGRILHHEPQTHNGFGVEYQAFCRRIGIPVPPLKGAFRGERRYWLRLS